MKLMIAAEFESTGSAEMSWFHRLAAGKGTNPLRLAPWPALIALQLDVIAAVMTKVAGLLVTLLTELLMVTVNDAPLSAMVVAGVV